LPLVVANLPASYCSLWVFMLAALPQCVSDFPLEAIPSRMIAIDDDPVPRIARKELDPPFSIIECGDEFDWHALAEDILDILCEDEFLGVVWIVFVDPRPFADLDSHCLNMTLISPV
jgi:hypothetical protein